MQGCEWEVTEVVTMRTKGADKLKNLFAGRDCKAGCGVRLEENPR